MVKIGVIGLGYVGLPICLNISKSFNTVGFDISQKRVSDLKKKNDYNNEFNKKDFLKKKILFSYKIDDLKNCNFYIICVPTPLKKNNIPDLSAVEKSFKMISKVIKKNDIIVLESTVYPGVTKRYAKFLQQKTKLTLNKDIHVCYSPERINPGDKKNNLKNIKKIVAFDGKNQKVKKNLYKVYKKLSKKVIFSTKLEEAETAKGIENIQRDLNIALFNELLLICKKLNLNFNEIVRLASSKWNFLKFSPGLVGGHCLPVDPYYLTFVAKRKGYSSKVTLSGRNINNYMKNFVIQSVLKSVDKLKNKTNIKICVCGLTYKYGVADIRNSQKIEIFNYLKKKYKSTRAYDPFLKDFKAIPKNIEKYNFVLFLSKGEKFKKLVKKLDYKKLIDPFHFFSN